MIDVWRGGVNFLEGHPGKGLAKADVYIEATSRNQEKRFASLQHLRFILSIRWIGYLQ